MSDNDDLLLPNEAAHVVRLSPSTLAKMRCSGGGPVFIKAGRSVLYSRTDLNEWLKARRRVSTSDQGDANNVSA
jgi:hypothetical protein